VWATSPYLPVSQIPWKSTHNFSGVILPTNRKYGSKQYIPLNCERRNISEWLWKEQTWVDHRFRYRSDGSFTISRAEALVTWVNAKLKHSRLPNEPELSRRARSASVDRDGSVSLRGPPFCCCSHYTWQIMCTKQNTATLFYDYTYHPELASNSLITGLRWCKVLTA